MSILLNLSIIPPVLSSDPVSMSGVSTFGTISVTSSTLGPGDFPPPNKLPSESFNFDPRLDAPSIAEEKKLFVPDASVLNPLDAPENIPLKAGPSEVTPPDIVPHKPLTIEPMPLIAPPRPRKLVFTNNIPPATKPSAVYATLPNEPNLSDNPLKSPVNALITSDNTVNGISNNLATSNNTLTIGTRTVNPISTSGRSFSPSSTISALNRSFI